MSTINQNKINENIQTLQNLTQQFNKTVAGFDEKINHHFDIQIQAINATFESIKRELNSDFSRFEGNNSKTIGDLQTEASRLFLKVENLKESLDDFTQKNTGLNARLDQFSAKAEVLQSNLDSLATNDLVGKVIAEQGQLLTGKLASKDSLEELKRRIGGEDGEGGLTGRIGSLVTQNSLSEAKAELIQKAQDANKTNTWMFLLTFTGIVVTFLTAVWGLFFNPQLEGAKQQIEQMQEAQNQILQKLEKLEQKEDNG
ncbi:MAG: hypothetical protein F6J86_22970 [Symploca sp. SIO1B1]|nr:hypothetical protein [Symploca sp. SIO2D2]NER96671.1 hypothetical protein [Symploca sp. SIO1B1]